MRTETSNYIYENKLSVFKEIPHPAEGVENAIILDNECGSTCELVVEYTTGVITSYCWNDFVCRDTLEMIIDSLQYCSANYELAASLTLLIYNPEWLILYSGDYICSELYEKIVTWVLQKDVEKDMVKYRQIKTHDTIKFNKFVKECTEKYTNLMLEEMGSIVDFRNRNYIRIGLPEHYDAWVEFYNEVKNLEGNFVDLYVNYNGHNNPYAEYSGMTITLGNN